MSWTIDEHPTALKYFASLVQSDDDFALMEAAISIAQDAEPDLDLQTVQAELDRLQVRLAQRPFASSASSTSFSMESWALPAT